MVTPEARIIIGDALSVLRTLPAGSVQCCVTSPPYWGLRDYGVSGQIGLEERPEAWLGRLLPVFAEVWRVLKADGCLWVNMGDCYAGGGNGQLGANSICAGNPKAEALRGPIRRRNDRSGLKPKDLVGQPWMLAFALRSAGWYLRRDIIWQKPNPMPESVYDRPNTAHEYVFLLSKSARYFYDAAAIAEPVTGGSHTRGNGVNPKCAGWADGPGSHRAVDHAQPSPKDQGRAGRELKYAGKFGREPGWRPRQNASFSGAVNGLVETRNSRSVWTFPIEPYSGAHFAAFPRELPKRCILASSRLGDTVLDPFAGSGTTGAVALSLGRSAILIDLNPANERLMNDRLAPWRGQGHLL